MTPEIAAEAATWIARLHGPDRSPRMERECLDWQARSAAHRLAFERSTDVWESVRGVKLSDAFASASSRSGAAEAIGRSGRSRWALALMCIALVVGAGVGAYVELWRNAGVYATQVGEQRLVVLDDGTRMSLNTDTQVKVEMGPALRAVSIRGGEALFEVAKDGNRPFVVRAAGSEVVAVGTLFSVRLAGGPAAGHDSLAVMLVEGRVTVRPASGVGAQGVAPARSIAMNAGERVRLIEPADVPEVATHEQVDRPPMEQLLAWQRNEANFDDTSLADAVAEMNRYSRTPIVLVGDTSLSAKRVSGLYRTGDSAGFARAVAALHGLAVREQGGRLELMRSQ